MLQTFARRATAFALAGGLVASLTTSAVQAAPASPVTSAAAPVNGLISYTNGNNVFVANPDGSNPREVAADASGATAWAPDGSRFVYRNSNGIITSRRLDGTGEVQIADSGFDPAWSADGRRIVFDANDRIRYATADGAFQSEVLFDPAPDCFDVQADIGPGDVVVFARKCAGDSNLRLFKATLGDAEPTQLTETGFAPAISPDGQKVVYLVENAQHVDEIWTANIDGSNQSLLIADGFDPSWSPDGASVVYNDFSTIGAMRRIDVTTKVVTPITGVGFFVTWQPIRRNVVDRVWGQDHVDTAIATSQFNYADAGKSDPFRVVAKAVVLSRDDTFLDALVGSAFAARSSAPLLITRRTDLDTRVEAEIKRVLGPSGIVFLLGGPIALNQPVEDRLHALGYSTERIFGQTHFDTAIAIDRKLSTGRTITPHIAIVATGVNFFDALAAGAAAGAQPGTVIVLTNGDQLPAQSAAYLNTLNPDSTAPNGTLIVSAGGPGDRALINAFQGNQLPSWPDSVSYARLVGNNEKDSALLIANGFFSAPGLTAVATNRTWMDALTGGAMVGFNGGPLLITDPTSLYPGVQQYLSTESGSLSEAAMLGGPVALSDSLKAPIGDAISVPGQWDFQDHTPSQTAVAAIVRAEQESHVSPPATATITRSS